jgi:hypothetical protein
VKFVLGWLSLTHAPTTGDLQTQDVPKPSVVDRTGHDGQSGPAHDLHLRPPTASVRAPEAGVCLPELGLGGCNLMKVQVMQNPTAGVQTFFLSGVVLAVGEALQSASAASFSSMKDSVKFNSICPTAIKNRSFHQLLLLIAHSEPSRQTTQ